MHPCFGCKVVCACMPAALEAGGKLHCESCGASRAERWTLTDISVLLCQRLLCLEHTARKTCLSLFGYLLICSSYCMGVLLSFLVPCIFSFFVCHVFKFMFELHAGNVCLITFQIAMKDQKDREKGAWWKVSYRHRKLP